MNEIPVWLNATVSIGGLLGTLVTAIATFFLWRVTQVLARETTRMVEASSQPHVVATLDPNRWSMRHFDLNVNNTGNGTAYDISIDFDPPLENGEARAAKEIPLKRISVLKPGQSMSSYLSAFGPLEGKRYTVSISWRRNAKSSVREENIYTLSMEDIEGISKLGNDPLVQIAEYIKKMQEDIKQVSRGSARIQVDAFLTSDRLHEKRVSARASRARRQRHRQAVAEAPSKVASQDET
ncbi:hypothetical protein [Janthinobacterium sp. LB3P112]|uniref:hypothetical protein n=1 Tax=Janthinobacterium sp. LB3P112 TaxID=3424196 RepID=UPI003F202647